MFTRTTLDIDTPAGVRVTHGLIAQDEPRGLVVMLPGRAYTSEAPGLYYPRMVAADAGYDILSMTFACQVAPERADFSTIDAEIRLAVDAVLRRRGYDRIVFVGKSLGSPYVAALAQPYNAERVILLTPIGSSVQDTGALPTLAIIGTNDSAYDPARVEADKARPNLRWLVLDGMDHGLEVAGDWAATLDGMKTILAACAEFLS